MPPRSRRLRRCSAASGTPGLLYRRGTRPSGMYGAMAGRYTCCIALDPRGFWHDLQAVCKVVKEFVEALGMSRGSDERFMQLCFQAGCTWASGNGAMAMSEGRTLL